MHKEKDGLITRTDRYSNIYELVCVVKSATDNVLGPIFLSIKYSCNNSLCIDGVLVTFLQMQRVPFPLCVVGEVSHSHKAQAFGSYTHCIQAHNDHLSMWSITLQRSGILF